MASIALKAPLALGLVLVAAGCVADVDGGDDVVADPNPLAWETRRVAGGSFEMGSPDDEVCRQEFELLHTVELTQGFDVMVHEVRQSDWDAVVDRNESVFQGCDDCPMEHVTWWDAVAYANAVSELAGLPACYRLVGCSGEVGAGYVCRDVEIVDGDRPQDCRGWRLPTEAEWEFVARSAGEVRTPVPAKDALVITDATTQTCEEAELASGRDPGEFAWMLETSQGKTHPVMQLEPNDLGVYDISGNVIEWVWDFFGPYDLEDHVDPLGPDEGDERVCRGGGFRDELQNLRAATRIFGIPANRVAMVGVRLVRSVD